MIRRLKNWWNARRRNRQHSDDWQVGDLAECIYDGLWLRGNLAPTHFVPQFGRIYAVAGIEQPNRPELAPPGAVMLLFDAFHPCAYVSTAFRKVQPRADQAEAADAEFIASLKPARTPALTAEPAQ